MRSKSRSPSPSSPGSRAQSEGEGDGAAGKNELLFASERILELSRLNIDKKQRREEQLEEHLAAVEKLARQRHGRTLSLKDVVARLYYGNRKHHEDQLALNAEKVEKDRPHPKLTFASPAGVKQAVQRLYSDTLTKRYENFKVLEAKVQAKRFQPPPPRTFTPSQRKEVIDKRWQKQKEELERLEAWCKEEREAERRQEEREAGRPNPEHVGEFFRGVVHTNKERCTICNEERKNNRAMMYCITCKRAACTQCHEKVQKCPQCTGQEHSIHKGVHVTEEQVAKRVAHLLSQAKRLATEIQALREEELRDEAAALQETSLHRHLAPSTDRDRELVHWLHYHDGEGRRRRAERRHRQGEREQVRELVALHSQSVHFRAERRAWSVEAIEDLSDRLHNGESGRLLRVAKPRPRARSWSPPRTPAAMRSSRRAAISRQKHSREQQRRKKLEKENEPPPKRRGGGYSIKLQAIKTEDRHLLEAPHVLSPAGSPWSSRSASPVGSPQSSRSASPVRSPRNSRSASPAHTVSPTYATWPAWRASGIPNDTGRAIRARREAAAMQQVQARQGEEVLRELQASPKLRKHIAAGRGVAEPRGDQAKRHWRPAVAAAKALAGARHGATAAAGARSAAAAVAGARGDTAGTGVAFGEEGDDPANATLRPEDVEASVEVGRPLVVQAAASGKPAATARGAPRRPASARLAGIAASMRLGAASPPSVEASAESPAAAAAAGQRKPLRRAVSAVVKASRLAAAPADQPQQQQQQAMRRSAGGSTWRPALQ